MKNGGIEHKFTWLLYRKTTCIQKNTAMDHEFY